MCHNSFTQAASNKVNSCATPNWLSGNTSNLVFLDTEFTEMLGAVMGHEKFVIHEIWHLSDYEAV